MAETTITNRIKDYINAIDGCLIIKKHNNQYGRKGEPDLLGALHGRFIAIEVKQPGKEPTKIQHARLREWARAGAITLWGTSLEDVQAKLLEEWGITL